MTAPRCARGPGLRRWGALLVAGLAGCGGGGSGSPTGTGGSNGLCQTLDCLDAGTGTVPPTWWVEVDPPPGSTAAVAFLPATMLPTLSVDRLMTVTATFSGPINVVAPSKTTAIVTVSSPLPGGPALSFQAAGAVPAAASNTVVASLQVPGNLSGRVATMTLVPLPPDDQQTPVYINDPTMPIKLNQTMATSIGMGDSTLSGVLLSSNAMGAPGFVARAFQAGAQVSNAAPTQSNGSFQLVFPSTVSTVLSLAIQLTPQPDSIAPWFVATPFAVSGPFPVALTPFPNSIVLPSYASPSPFSLRVVDQNGQPVIGAFVQAQTTLPGTPNDYGQTLFSRSGQSDDNGFAALELFPGAPADLQYGFVVVPPPGSSGATSCLSPIDPSMNVLLQLTGARTEVAGHVVDNGSNPVANVTITATPGPAPVPGCLSTPAAPGTTTTDASGNFSLLLDQGTYQLDYDPPGGSSAPRWTELSVTVPPPSATPAPRTVVLPAMGVVSGMVLDPNNNNKNLPSATVRLYEPCTAPCSSAPVLKAQAVSDANGAFRFVVPLPTTGPDGGVI
ncbi:MAG TPA: carboxypeptidase regulatory-like domain-containing protein [Polyangia bacterium]|nr:carboxypeptidase regulatory-like domain-containing protein [Polyangia bacterium]